MEGVRGCATEKEGGREEKGEGGRNGREEEWEGE